MMTDREITTIYRLQLCLAACEGVSDSNLTGGWVKSLVSWGNRQTAEMITQDTEIAALKARIADYEEAYAAVVSEVCAGDEKHCPCVPHLRKRIAELEAERRWIPCSERLPEAYASVEVVNNNGFWTTDYIAVDTWAASLPLPRYWASRETRDYWRPCIGPLPEPPKLEDAP